MRLLSPYFALTAVGLLPLLTGCNSMEQKLGRGMANVWEPVRMGELRRSVEQTGLADGGTVAATYGVVHGVNRTIQRTLVGAFEIVTFPIPTEPLIHPVNPVFPDNQQAQSTAGWGSGTDQFIGLESTVATPFLPNQSFNPIVE